MKKFKYSQNNNIEIKSIFPENKKYGTWENFKESLTSVLLEILNEEKS